MLKLVTARQKQLFPSDNLDEHVSDLAEVTHCRSVGQPYDVRVVCTTVVGHIHYSLTVHRNLHQEFEQRSLAMSATAGLWHDE